MNLIRLHQLASLRALLRSLGQDLKGKSPSVDSQRLGPLAGQPLVGKVVSASVATVFSWLGNRLWTFRHRRRAAVAHEFGLFLFFNAVGLAIALACLGFSRYVLDLHSQLADNIAGNGVGLVLGTLFRFWAYRTFVFRGELEAEERDELDEPREPQGVWASGR